MPNIIVDNHIFHNPVEFALSKIGGTYKMPILWRLKDKVWRYSEFRKSLAHVSDRMLSKSLKELEKDGFINRQIFASVPPKVEYSITERGNQAVLVIDVVRNFGLKMMVEFGVDHSKPNSAQPN